MGFIQIRIKYNFFLFEFMDEWCCCCLTWVKDMINPTRWLCDGDELMDTYKRGKCLSGHQCGVNIRFSNDEVRFLLHGMVCEILLSYFFHTLEWWWSPPFIGWTRLLAVSCPLNSRKGFPLEDSSWLSFYVYELVIYEYR